jgi:hypothetical protein
MAEEIARSFRSHSNSSDDEEQEDLNSSDINREANSIEIESSN